MPFILIQLLDSRQFGIYKQALEKFPLRGNTRRRRLQGSDAVDRAVWPESSEEGETIVMQVSRLRWRGRDRDHQSTAVVFPRRWCFHDEKQAGTRRRVEPEQFLGIVAFGRDRCDFLALREIVPGLPGPPTQLLILGRPCPHSFDPGSIG